MRILICTVLAVSTALLVPAAAQRPGAPGEGLLLAGDPVIVGAGDIADCETTTDEAVAALLDTIDGTVFTAGDNVYPLGRTEDFDNCYAPTWGRQKSRTRPSPGNHDYYSAGAAPYYAYFGSHAGPAGVGYCSYDLGAWHVVSLNSNIAVGAGSVQEQWLRADLAANPTKCTLAYWHHPLFSSGLHGGETAMRDLYQALYDFGADVLVTGHDHDYEQFHRQNPDGVLDADGPGAPDSAMVQLNQGAMATLAWSPPGGQTGYALWSIPLDGSPQGIVGLPPTATRAMHDTAGRSTCYVVLALTGSAVTGNSDVLCASPGASTLSTAVRAVSERAGRMIARAPGPSIGRPGDGGSP